MKLESNYQSGLIKRLKQYFPELIVLKNDPTYLQGVPDLILVLGGTCAFLEVKRSINSKHQPNQDYYINHVNELGGFARFIFEDNESDVVENLKQYFSLR